MLSLNQEMINRIVKLATITATEKVFKMIKEHQEQEKANLLDKRLRNTRLLLRNYRNLKEHTALIHLDIGELNQLLQLDPINLNTLEVESIKKSKKRTLIMVAFIEKMLEIYKEINPKRHDLLYSLYISDKKNTVQTLACTHNVSTRAIYKDLDLAFKEIGSLLWGVDSINLL